MPDDPQLIPPGQEYDHEHTERVVIHPTRMLIGQGATMHQQHEALLAIRATVISVLALAMTIAVFYYFNLVGGGEAPDYHLMAAGREIPAESYPILLLTFWTLSQRMDVRWGFATVYSTYGTVLFWIDVAEAGLVALYLLFVLATMLAQNTSMTFIIVILAFMVQAIADVFLNVHHRYGAGTITMTVDNLAGGGASAAAQQLSGTPPSLGNLSVSVTGVINWMYMRFRDGPLMPLPPYVEVRSALKTIESTKN